MSLVIKIFYKHQKMPELFPVDTEIFRLLHEETKLHITESLVGFPGTVPLKTLFINKGRSPATDAFPPSRLKPSPAEVFSNSTHIASLRSARLPAAAKARNVVLKCSPRSFFSSPCQHPRNKNFHVQLRIPINLWAPQHYLWPEKIAPYCCLVVPKGIFREKEQ